MTSWPDRFDRREEAIAIQANARIIAAGAASVRTGTAFALATYNTDPLLIPFSGDGKATPRSVPFALGS
jgi:hypothetical protein